MIQVEIFTADGRLISATQQAVNGGVSSINMIGYASGNYLVRVVRDGKIWTGKLFWTE